MKENKVNGTERHGLLSGIAIIAALILIVCITGWISSRPAKDVLQGEAQATEYRVSGKVPGRVEKIYVREGDFVKKGDTLAMIESPEVRAKLAQAMAVKKAAEAQRNKAVKGARQEQIAAAYEMWQKALAGEDIMKKSFDRTSRLYEKKIVTAQKYDEVEAAYKAAKATTAAAKSQYDMAVNGAREEDKAAAIALVDQANGAVMEVEAYLSELYLTSPSDGMVSEIFPKCGELVGTGSPVMTVTDTDEMWFTFNIREDFLYDIKNGTTLKVGIPALGNGENNVRVTYMRPMASYATWRATKASGDFDARTFEVKMVPENKIEGLLPGMSALIIMEK